MQIRVLWSVLSRSGSDRFHESRVFLFWKKSRQTQNLKTKTAKNKQKKLRNCHSSQRNYQKKLKRLKFYRNFEQTFSKRVLLGWRSGNFWCRNWNRHYRKPGGHRRFYQPTEKCKHKQEDGYWYEHSSMMKNEKTESLPASELNHLSRIFLNAWRKKNGEEYEPATVSSFRRSIQR